AKAIQLGLDAFERAVGTRPALIRSGGTLPIVPALTEKGIPTVITGFGLPDSNIHSPNERLLAEHVPLATAAARELLLSFAALCSRPRPSSTPRRRVVHPPARDHRRDDLGVEVLPGVAVENDEVGRVGRDQAAPAALVARQPGGCHARRLERLLHGHRLLGV